MPDKKAIGGVHIKWLTDFLKSALPRVTFAFLVILWLITSLHQVGINEQGIRERFGQPVGDVLEAGIHLGFPWPIDRVRTFPSHKTRLMLVGFRTTTETQRSDLIWTVAHGIEEDRFMTASGSEVISFDIELYYRVKDVNNYAYMYSDPDLYIKHAAYKAIYDRTKNTNTDQLLSRDRASLARGLMADIQTACDSVDAGIEITEIDIIAIHPPFEIASSYQAVVSAQIEKEHMKIVADTYREQIIPEAEATAYSQINAASEYSFGQVSTAMGESAGFLTLLESLQNDMDLYEYRRWNEIVSKGLADRRVFIVSEKFLEGEGADDGTELWFDFQ